MDNNFQIPNPTQSEKKNAERYLVTLAQKANVWAEDYKDLLHELEESGIDPDTQVIRIDKLDF